MLLLTAGLPGPTKWSVQPATASKIKSNAARIELPFLASTPLQYSGSGNSRGVGLCVDCWALRRFAAIVEGEVVKQEGQLIGSQMAQVVQFASIAGSAISWGSIPPFGRASCQAL